MLPAGPASPAARVVWDVSEQGQALLAVLFPHLAGLRVHRVEDTGQAVMIAASCQAGSASCPRCGQASAQVHGGYGRTVADGAAGGRPVLIVLQVRRFRCRNPGCPAVTFAEQAAVAVSTPTWPHRSPLMWLHLQWRRGWSVSFNLAPPCGPGLRRVRSWRQDCCRLARVRASRAGCCRALGVRRG